MKNNINITQTVICLLTMFLGRGQEDVVHNYGNIQIHDTGIVGFHSDVTNDGAFNQNLGLVGFYGENKSITVSGTSNPVFYDVEIETDADFFIDNTMGIKNNLNLIAGDIVTSRTASEVNINFIDTAFYTGDGSFTKIDGYAAISDKSEFIFPVGQNNRIRPLGITSNGINDYAKCGYFYEDPNTSSTFGFSFNTNTTADALTSVSNYEFWHLDGAIPSKVTLTWDEESFVSLFADSLSEIRVVGWDVVQNQWVDLGNTDITGDLENGKVTSDTFIPDNYQILSLAGSTTVLEPTGVIDLDNYFLTPNGDGKNDFLVIDGLENSPNNTLQIFNRFGTLVYIQKNYDNSFTGLSNVSGVIKRNKGLPSGVYFYIITLNDLAIKHQGYLYLSTYQEN
ncbi:gliding motility-associated C-terminal domain-containing protein [Costertonia aggregata]|uniref:Gliding motility-associated C-terminal domain-containing protein n=1 Tax=Costertonia aggregata TaxID=343403 RepID=A0A7H9ALJ1_9FLAO|nr:gliding motility-associated C-terminal domain-containing protein [Costertonia aggregata]QLG44326.1 gliding motility-associated C-terminal domain-containing protein [Costertonia aggregata]